MAKTEQAAELIRLLDEARAEMLATLQEVDIEAEVFPGWHVKHFLAHIAGWDEATTISLQACRDDLDYEIPAFRGIDHFNEHSVETRQGLNYQQVFAEWQLMRSELKAVLETMPAEKFEGSLLYPWGPRGSIDQLVKIMIHHEIEHCSDIRRLKGNTETGA